MKTLIGILSLGALYGLESFIPLFQNRPENLHVRHAAKNLFFGLINAAVTHVFFAGLVYHVLEWASGREFGLLRIVPLPRFLMVPASFLLLDLWMYCWHRINHVVGFFWRFHRMHHSDAEMDASTALRFHTGEIILSHCARLLVLPLLGLDFSALLLYEMCLFPVILFHHSNIALPEKWDKLMRGFIVTPNMHRVHHSQVLDETNSNYSTIFSFWDRLFGSFIKRDDILNIRFGLTEFTAPYWQTISGMFRTPWVGKI